MKLYFELLYANNMDGMDKFLENDIIFQTLISNDKI